jgi:hypothetical protein
MNLLNGLFTAVFGVVLRPIEALGGEELAIAVTSAFFGVLALFVFKHISWQAGIKGTKDRIKGHLIEIRIYQDDLVVVGKSVGKILFRNLQYLGLNFGPFIPLALPFTVVAAQLVVRYGFEPVPLTENVAALEPGGGTMLEIRMAPGHEAEVAGLAVRLPDGLRATSKLVRAPSDGRAFQEFVAVESGEWTIELELADGTVVEKCIATGDVAPRAMQPERVRGFWSAWLWPAEDTLPGSLERVSFAYPNRALAFLPDGPLGVLVGLLVWSMIFGFAALKPLGVTI